MTQHTRPVDPTTPDRFITPVDRVFVRTHFGKHPELDASSWTLTVEGLVDRPLELDLPTLLALPQAHLTAVHECLGNPLHPDVPTRAVANLDWTGVPLSTVLDLAGPRPEARHIWLEGADTGSFADEHDIAYLKDLPLEQARAEVLVAHRMNGEPLLPQHGFPVRAVAPRMFTTNSVKWLTRIVLAAERPDHLFTTRLYTRTLPGETAPRPAREIDVNSKLLTPRQVPAGTTELAGRTWSYTDVTTVEIAVDEGPWQQATLEPRGTHPTWQRFALTHHLTPGPHRIRSRATDSAGRVQPPSGARNEVHEIEVTAS
ncbi:molybdopterin-dependent oxidoreductase [Kitasatospora sp. NPDC048722]|uniref:molybdopterin-dependent oxidoreductase n=1 Tax=Kitasatospora sp. NPDC048722 TaxID=3155639 RepID=UPI0033CCE4F6